MCIVQLLGDDLAYLHVSISLAAVLISAWVASQMFWSRKHFKPAGKVCRF